MDARGVETGSDAPAPQRPASAEDRFGHNVRIYRLLRRMTQAEVAERLAKMGVNLHPSAIAKIELRDTDRPRAIRLEEASALARVLGVSLDALIGPYNDDWQDVTVRITQTLYGIYGEAEKLDGLAAQLGSLAAGDGQDAQDLREAVRLDDLRVVLRAMPWNLIEQYVAHLIQEDWFRFSYGPGLSLS